MPLDGSAVTGSSPVPTGEADYLRARAVQEQVAAQKAASEAARDRHDQLAAMYRFRAMMLDYPPLTKAARRREGMVEPA